MSKSALLVHMALALACCAVSAAPAIASCRDDIKELRARLNASPPRSVNVVQAKKELAKAEQAAPFDEVGCDNDVARAWRAYKAPPAPQTQANGPVAPR